MMIVVQYFITNTFSKDRSKVSNLQCDSRQYSLFTLRENNFFKILRITFSGYFWEARNISLLDNMSLGKRQWMFFYNFFVLTESWENASRWVFWSEMCDIQITKSRICNLLEFWSSTIITVVISTILYWVEQRSVKYENDEFIIWNRKFISLGLGVESLLEQRNNYLQLRSLRKLVCTIQPDYTPPFRYFSSLRIIIFFVISLVHCTMMTEPCFTKQEHFITCFLYV